MSDDHGFHAARLPKSSQSQKPKGKGKQKKNRSGNSESNSQGADGMKRNHGDAPVERKAPNVSDNQREENTHPRKKSRDKSRESEHKRLSTSRDRSNSSSHRKSSRTRTDSQGRKPRSSDRKRDRTTSAQRKGHDRPVPSGPEELGSWETTPEPLGPAESPGSPVNEHRTRNSRSTNKVGPPGPAQNKGPPKTTDSTDAWFNTTDNSQVTRETQPVLKPNTRSINPTRDDNRSFNSPAPSSYDAGRINSSYHGKSRHDTRGHPNGSQKDSSNYVQEQPTGHWDSDNRRPHGGRSNFDDRDDEFSYDNFRQARFKHSQNDRKVVTEQEGDLFKMPEVYALANCVAEDMNMGSGIAVTFRTTFKRVPELLDQNQREGGLAYLEVEGRYIYYLVTKRFSNGKPTNENMLRSIVRLKDAMIEHGVKKLAIPRLGCGLDWLVWDDVSAMLEFAFNGLDVEIVVCNFEKAEEVMQEKKTNLVRRKCRVINVQHPITDFNDYTIIIYFGSQDGFVDNTLQALEDKFKIITDYKASVRTVGKSLWHPKMNDRFALCGFIIREKHDDTVQFANIQSCIDEVNRINNKMEKETGYKYYIIGIQDQNSILMTKIVNLLRYTFYDVDIHICPNPRDNKTRNVKA